MKGLSVYTFQDIYWRYQIDVSIFISIFELMDQRARKEA